MTHNANILELDHALINYSLQPNEPPGPTLQNAISSQATSVSEEMPERSGKATQFSVDSLVWLFGTEADCLSCAHLLERPLLLPI